MALFPLGPDGWITQVQATGTGSVYLDRGDDLGVVVDQVRSAGDTLGLDPSELAITLENEGRLRVDVVAARDGARP